MVVSVKFCLRGLYGECYAGVQFGGRYWCEGTKGWWQRHWALCRPNEGVMGNLHLTADFGHGIGRDVAGTLSSGFAVRGDARCK